MFIFFCVLGKEAREAWAQVFCHGKRKKFVPSTSTAISGASLAESGIMLDSPREMSPPQHHQEQEVRDSPMLGVHEGQRVEETSDDLTTEDHSEVVTNLHAF